ncbi:MAG: carboxypeptidase-like regulatory domain-containing protein [Vicinamibacterales bacterium]
MRLFSVLIGVLFLLLSPAPARSQTFTGGVRGQVRDADGGIGGVTVVLTNDATGIARTTLTNEIGHYLLPALPPGTYRLTVTLQNYKAVALDGVRVGTQEVLVVDVVLEPGGVQETVVVSGDAPRAVGSTVSLGGDIGRLQFDRLPAPGRNAFLVATTLPMVNSLGDPQFNRQQDQSEASRISLGGAGVRAHSYLIDGVPITDLTGRAVVIPTIEAVDDLRVQVRSYDASVGRTGGGVFNVTARSGTNTWRGTSFYQTRPVWGQSRNFFNEVAGLSKKETGLSDAYYRLAGGGVGGPLRRSRTFVWTAAEGYRSATTRNMQEMWPSHKQRVGDFSSTTRGGAPVVLYNPWCRATQADPRCPATGTGSRATGGLFTNGIIPLSHPAVSPVAARILHEWPTSTINGPISAGEDGEPNAVGTAYVVDRGLMWTMKAEHKLRDAWSLGALYIYNRTDEPGSTLFSPDQWYMADQAGFFGPLRRRPQVAVANSTMVLNDSNVLALRYGWSTWEDSYAKQEYTAGLGSLGFSPAFVSALGPGGRETFPSLVFDEVVGVGGWGGQPSRWTSPYSVNATLTRLSGAHSLTIGADARRLGVRTTTESLLSGNFKFNRLFTSNDGIGGHDLASFLLGLPASGSVPANAGPGEWFTRYYGAYAQDDWRVTPRVTLSYGLRLEHEDGLREAQNRQTVGFDRTLVNPIDALVPKAGTLLAGRTLRGGLIFAGVDGAPVEQGRPPALKPSPRVSATFAANASTIVRAGYGLFWTPWNYDQAQHGQIGFTRTTQLAQSSGEHDVPLTRLDDPFPGGIQRPVGSALGLLTGVGGEVNVVDPEKGAPKAHQYSIDLQRELPGQTTVTLGYAGKTARDIGFGPASAININQIDPQTARLLYPAAGGGWDAAALRASVTNPFFGVAEAGELATRETIPRGQLLRPFPQFGDVLLREVTSGSRRQYHAVLVEVDKRLTRTWGGRFSYTWSRTLDNQFADGGVFQTGTLVPQNNYDLQAEYGLSNLDTPHRIVLAPMVSLPGPAVDRRVAHALFGGWTASANVELVSGAPLNVAMTEGASEANLGLLGGRQRPNLIGDPATPGDDAARVSYATHPDARWFDADAFASPGAGAYGNAPRTIGNARYQFRKNIDVVLAKAVSLAGTGQAEVRVEIINLTNTPKFFGVDSNAVDNAAFGRISGQAGFMRIVQLSVRYRF